MSTEADRRAPGTPRISFEAMVEVGGALGPSFEAQAINLSEEGMHLRTAYLPEVGQPLTCRFDAGAGAAILASGEVIWKEEEGCGGEFGIRFTNLDPESAAVLSRILGMNAAGPLVQSPGARVRLHIEGLASPMRARVKESSDSEVTAFSELGFLQVGKQLELEDAATGTKRPALIDRVEVEIDPESQVPQLVVTLKYDDAMARAEPAAIAEGASLGAEPMQNSAAESPMAEDDEQIPVVVAEASNMVADAESIDIASGKMKGPVARGAAKVAPAISRWASRAKVTMALLAAKRRSAAKDKDDFAIPLRRMTSPPPGGGLHTAGRKVVRGDVSSDEKDPLLVKKLGNNKRKIAVGVAVGAAAILAIVAFRKPAAPPPLASAPPPEPPIVQPVAPAAAPPAAVDPMVSLTPPTSSPAAMIPVDGAKDDKHLKHGKVAPFGNGPVAHGNVLRLKMDGAIEKIQGASQPTGFTVTIPNRRSLEAAAPLASRDARIGSIHISNDPNGAELAVAFKDGVPNYQVRARGDVLELVLAPAGTVDGKEASAGSDNHPSKHADATPKKHHPKH